MHRRSTIARRTLKCTVLFVTAGSALAGPIDPPAGPVDSTMKTLEQIEPRVLINSQNTPGDADALFKITSPGSYYMNGSITIMAGRMFLEITASNVTVDLSGFRINGAAGTLDGIYIASGMKNVVIHNGTIAGFSQGGIDGLSASLVTVEDVNLVDIGQDAVSVGQSSKVLRVSVQDAGEDGITTFGGSIVRDCTTYSCTNYGFYAGGATSYQGCTARDNNASGFFVTSGSSVTGCLAIGNAGWGIGSLVGSDTISITDNTINVPNTTGAHGIGVYSKSTVRHNTITNNHSNEWTIYLSNDGNRVEGNTTSGGVQAVTTSGNKNLVIGNFHYGSAPVGAFSLTGSNTVGPVISATGTITSTNPWANFWLP